MKRTFAAILGVLAMLAVTVVLTGSALASSGARASIEAASSPALLTPSVAAAAACSPGGPYHEGDRAVWHNCDATPDRVYVRKYFPMNNYDVCVAAFSSMSDSWTWTIDMEYRGTC